MKRFLILFAALALLAATSSTGTAYGQSCWTSDSCLQACDQFCARHHSTCRGLNVGSCDITTGTATCSYSCENDDHNAQTCDCGTTTPPSGSPIFKKKQPQEPPPPPDGTSKKQVVKKGADRDSKADSKDHASKPPKK